jgi:hypothetical protein
MLQCEPWILSLSRGKLRGTLVISARTPIPSPVLMLTSGDVARTTESRRREQGNPYEIFRKRQKYLRVRVSLLTLNWNQKAI